METEIARRRINMIAAHFSVSPISSDEVIATSVLPMVCSVHHVPASETPLFSRLARAESNLTNSMVQPLAHVFSFTNPEPPKFSRPSSRVNADRQLLSKRASIILKPVAEWSPRLDVAESECKYVVTVEVPGVNINEIIDEVDDQNRKVAGCSNDLLTTFHKREILYGQYEVSWPLPAGVDKDNVSAIFLDGLLQIIVPKL